MVFIVTESGEVRDPQVREATHPDFVGPALEAIQKWRFKPGKKAGVAVSTRVSQQITFNIRGKGGVNSFAVPAKVPKELPEDLRYDQPPEVSRSVACVYPYELLVAGVTGRATVTFLVDERGLTRLVTVREATHLEFGQALKAAIEAWRFKPAKKNGKPSLARLPLLGVFGNASR